MQSTWSQQHLQGLAKQGVLDGSYLRHSACQGGPWDDFRERYRAHVEQGRWNWADEAAWAAEPEHWSMVKAAERLLQDWRRLDFQMDDNKTTGNEGDHGFSRSVRDEQMRFIDKSVVSIFTVEHLERFADPHAAQGSTCFGCKCLLGLVAAIAVFSRALVTAGAFAPVADTEGGDGFLLWRQEIGFVLAGIMLREGTLALELTRSPTWPLVCANFVERILHWEGSSESARTPVLGTPRRLRQLRHPRLPDGPRYHRGTDPSAATEWGKRARDHAARRAESVQRWWESGAESTRAATVRARLPPFDTELPYTADSRRWWAIGAGRRVRVLSLVAMHGALDLEIPELLRELFPSQLGVQFVLYGDSAQRICGKTEGSQTIRRLCEEAPVVHQQAGALHRAAWSREHLDPEDPRLFFPKPDGRGDALPPELITLTSITEAIWAARNFPGVPLIIFVGPPLLLHVAEDIQLRRDADVSDFWAGFATVSTCVRRGRCLLAAESLFRCEQFFYQTGVEIPFLRPMSVWVNATYRPRGGPVDGSAEVLVHSRGRLKYEWFFIKGVERLAGASFPFRIVGQEGRIVPFTEIAAFHAVVVLPWSPEICMLRHLFKMRVPTLVPDRTMLQNLVHVSNKRLLPYPYHLPAPGSNRSAVSEAHEYDPFLDTARPSGDMVGLEARAYWAEFSEYLLLPSLCHFASAAGLLVALYEMEGHKISAQMRAAYLIDLLEMKSFWRESLSGLLLAA